MKRSFSQNKIIPYSDVALWRSGLLPTIAPLVVTNGCFDILHPGHLFLLEQARELGNGLLVGVTSDAAVRRLKGPGRPAVPEMDRLRLLAGLEAVTAVCLFPEVDAVEFLRKTRPDVYAKGGDYTLETINQDERKLLEALGVPIRFLPKFEGKSTSRLIEDLRMRPNSHRPTI